MSRIVNNVQQVPLSGVINTCLRHMHEGAECFIETPRGQFRIRYEGSQWLEYCNQSQCYRKYYYTKLRIATRMIQLAGSGIYRIGVVQSLPHRSAAEHVPSVSIETWDSANINFNA